MAAAWQASGTLLGSTGADITPVIPAHATDDILILVASSRDVTETCLTPAGWTLLGGPADVTGWRTYVFYKRATGGAETNPLCDWNAATGQKYGQVHTIRGAITTGSPFAASALSADLTDTIASTGVTSTAASQLIAVVGIGSDNASASVVSVMSTDPASYTQRHYSTIATGADASGWCFDATRATAGATGTVTQDFNSTMPAAGVLVAAILNPAAGTIIAADGSSTGLAGSSVATAKVLPAASAASGLAGSAVASVTVFAAATASAGVAGSSVTTATLFTGVANANGAAVGLGTATNTEAVDGNAAGAGAGSGVSGVTFAGAAGSAGVGQALGVGRTSIFGVTKDNAGAPLGAVTVQLFRTSDDAFQTQLASTAAGNYVLYPDVVGPFYIVAYKAGAPDVAGTTVNTLAAA